MTAGATIAANGADVCLLWCATEVWLCVGDTVTEECDTEFTDDVCVKDSVADAYDIASTDDFATSGVLLSIITGLSAKRNKKTLALTRDFRSKRTNLSEDFRLRDITEIFVSVPHRSERTILWPLMAQSLRNCSKEAWATVAEQFCLTHPKFGEITTLAISVVQQVVVSAQLWAKEYWSSWHPIQLLSHSSYEE